MIDSLLELGCRPVFSLYGNRWVVATKLIELFVVLEPTLGPTTLTTGMRSGLLYSDTVNVVSVVGCFLEHSRIYYFHERRSGGIFPQPR